MLLETAHGNRGGGIPSNKIVPGAGRSRMASLAASRSPVLRTMLPISCLLNCAVTIESFLSSLGCQGFPVIRRA